MKRRLGLAVLYVGMLLASAQLFAQGPAGGQPPQNCQPAPRFAWWRCDRYQKHLGLTTDQVTRLEGAWQAALPELRKGRDDLDRQEAELSRLIETNADETVVTHQVDKVEAIRSRLNKARTLVIWRHRQMLTPEQRVKLKAMQDRERERTGAPPPPSPGGQRP